jgi:hypothetical protein
MLARVLSSCAMYRRLQSLAIEEAPGARASCRFGHFDIYPRTIILTECLLGIRHQPLVKIRRNNAPESIHTLALGGLGTGVRHHRRNPRFILDLFNDLSFTALNHVSLLRACVGRVTPRPGTPVKIAVNSRGRYFPCRTPEPKFGLLASGAGFERRLGRKRQFHNKTFVRKLGQISNHLSGPVTPKLPLPSEQGAPTEAGMIPGI